MAHTPTSHRKPRKRSPWLAIASVFFLLIALIGIFLFFNNRSKQEIKTKTNASSHRKIVTSIKKKKWIKQKTPVKIPILMYHAVHVMDPSEAASANLIVAPDIFESHIKRLKKEGYYFLAPNEAYRALNENALPEKKSFGLLLMMEMPISTLRHTLYSKSTRLKPLIISSLALFKKDENLTSTFNKC